MAVIGAVAVGGQRGTQPDDRAAREEADLRSLRAEQPRGRGNRGGAAGATAPVTPPPAPPVLKTPAELVKDALAYDKSDFVFDGTMERGRPGSRFTDLLTAGRTRRRRGALAASASVKTPEIAPDPAGDRQHQPSVEPGGTIALSASRAPTK
jgi:hypothetical protein